MTDERKQRVKKVYVEMEVIEDVPLNQVLSDKEFYPHGGAFLLIRQDGMMSVVSADINPVNEYVGFSETFIGSRPTIESQFVMDSRDVDEKMDAMIKRYDEDVARRKHDIEQEFEMKRKDLEHEYEKRMMELEAEQPKRCAQGEWVSGKTLTEIIKTLTPPFTNS